MEHWGFGPGASPSLWISLAVAYDAGFAGGSERHCSLARHESTETTQIYLHADMQLKERALAHATSSGLAPDRFRPPDPLLAFLESL